MCVGVRRRCVRLPAAVPHTRCGDAIFCGADMIVENDCLVSRFISVPKELGLNCSSFVAGIVEGMLDAAEFVRAATSAVSLCYRRCVRARVYMYVILCCFPASSCVCSWSPRRRPM